MFYFCKRDLTFKMMSIYRDPHFEFPKEGVEFERKWFADAKRRERERQQKNKASLSENVVVNKHNNQHNN